MFNPFNEFDLSVLNSKHNNKKNPFLILLNSKNTLKNLYIYNYNNNYFWGTERDHSFGNKVKSTV